MDDVWLESDVGYNVNEVIETEEEDNIKTECFKFLH